MDSSQTSGMYRLSPIDRQYDPQADRGHGHDQGQSRESQYYYNANNYGRAEGANTGLELPPPQPFQPSHNHFLPPLPSTSDADLTHPPTIAAAVGAKPASKAGGERRKGKRKAVVISDGDDSEPGGSDDEGGSTRRGRPSGAGNYTMEDVRGLLDAVDHVKPMGQTGWKKVYGRYEKWAKKHKRPVRDTKSLEAKYKALLKQRKPTGAAKRPEHLVRAREIEDSIRAQAGTRDIEDSDDDDDGTNNDRRRNNLDEDDDDDDDHSDSGDRGKTRTATVRSNKDAPSATRSTSANKNTASDLVSKLGQAFEPSAQRARDEERSFRSFQTSQFFAMNEQLRDAHAASDRLRADNLALIQRVSAAERERDLAQLRLEMRPPSLTAPPPVQKVRKSHWRGYPGVDLVRGKIKVVDTYPDEASDAEAWDSDKENRDPGPSSRWRDRSPFVPWKAPQGIRTPHYPPSTSASSTRFDSPHKSINASPSKESFTVADPAPFLGYAPAPSDALSAPASPA
ncbi:hypothetical protein DFP72DRAFT_1076214 [Ephemerocybe angulata]|uniref:DUF6818 domain-containing protein n=1 Tax=Ephemerocybe angulata TaxID=980116 RepID=A0A8H6HGM9_9AGAR|nr:hypothetical protein DFP72DRAFT_1076214 [Tulosesus angulatus]